MQDLLIKTRQQYKTNINSVWFNNRNQMCLLVLMTRMFCGDVNNVNKQCYNKRKSVDYNNAT